MEYQRTRTGKEIKQGSLVSINFSYNRDFSPAQNRRRAEYQGKEGIVAQKLAYDGRLFQSPTKKVFLVLFLDGQSVHFAESELEVVE